jgi:hypothetical protein
LKEFIVKIPLDYGNNSMLNSYGSTGEIEIKIKQTVIQILNIVIQKDDFTSEEQRRY